jgi:hypothetical protein
MDLRTEVSGDPARHAGVARYDATKSALEGVTRVLSAELGPRTGEIEVYVLSPARAMRGLGLAKAPVRVVRSDALVRATPLRRQQDAATPPLPAAWTTAHETKLTALTRSRDFYRITRDGRTRDAVCSLWSFRRHGPKATLTTTYSEAPILDDSGPVHTTVTYEVGVGPNAHGAPVVGETPEGLEVLDPSPGSPVLAYDPADRDIWYTAKTGCERALRAERDEFSSLPPAAAKLLVRAR